MQGLVIPNPGPVTFTMYDVTSTGITMSEPAQGQRKIIATYFVVKARRPLSIETSSAVPSSQLQLPQT